MHDPVVTFIERSKTRELEMTVFQHASVVPTSEIVGRELKGAYLKEGGGSWDARDSPSVKNCFCPCNAGGENARIRRISPLPLTERHCDG